LTVRDDLLHIIAELELRRAELQIRLLRDALHDGDDDLIEQNSRKSKLGRRGHVDAVRRRVEAREPGAFIRGRKFLLSPEAHEEELARSTARAERRVIKARPPVSPEGVDAGESELEERLLRQMRAR
jgi:hypothetical protein